MNADSAFHIGASHAICQDYARARAPAALPECSSGPTGPYVILSDGCSSSPDTDIGARLLVKAAEQALLEIGGTDPHEVARAHEEAARRALAWAEMAGLPPEAVDATLLTAHVRGGELILGCSGDGAICLRSRTGMVDAYIFSYPSGYPFYPSYAHQPGRLRALEHVGRLDKEVKHLSSARVEECLQLIDTSGSDSLTEVLSVRASDYLYAALFTDGVHSFYRAGRTEGGDGFEEFPAGEPLRELLSFKSSGGSFVARRMKRFLKDCEDRGWRHDDDLAVGALHLGGFERDV